MGGRAAELVDEVVESRAGATVKSVVTHVGAERGGVRDAGAAGDDAVVLPDDAVHSVEIKNESGIAVATNADLFSLDTVMTDLETVTIRTPDAGYIVVSGYCWCNVTMGSGSATVRVVSI